MKIITGNGILDTFLEKNLGIDGWKALLYTFIMCINMILAISHPITTMIAVKGLVCNSICKQERFLMWIQWSVFMGNVIYYVYKRCKEPKEKLEETAIVRSLFAVVLFIFNILIPLMLLGMGRDIFNDDGSGTTYFIGTKGLLQALFFIVSGMHMLTVSFDKWCVCQNCQKEKNKENREVKENHN